MREDRIMSFMFMLMCAAFAAMDFGLAYSVESECLAVFTFSSGLLCALGAAFHLWVVVVGRPPLMSK